MRSGKLESLTLQRDGCLALNRDAGRFLMVWLYISVVP
jgi:hypothetical protein